MADLDFRPYLQSVAVPNPKTDDWRDDRYTSTTAELPLQVQTVAKPSRGDRLFASTVESYGVTRIGEVYQIETTVVVGCSVVFGVAAFSLTLTPLPTLEEGVYSQAIPEIGKAIFQQKKCFHSTEILA